MKDFIYSVVAAAERYRSLPDKFIDTKMILLGQAIVCLVIGVAVLYTQSLVVDSCLIPVYQLKKP